MEIQQVSFIAGLVSFPSTPNGLIRSIIFQLRERRNDSRTIYVPAQPDITALRNLIEAPSLLVSLRRALVDTLHPPKIELTVQPLPVEELWSKSSCTKPKLVSVGMHAMIACILLTPIEADRQPRFSVTSVTFLAPKTKILYAPGKGKSAGGGGGGKKTKTPPSKGVPPRGADQQIIAPMISPKNLAPSLVVEPTIIAPTLTHLPPFNFITIGDPNGAVGPPSVGPGTGGGIGTGTGRGIGQGTGPGLGPGTGGGTGGGVFNIGGGISEPRVLERREPEYTDEARKAHIQGTVELLIIVRENGSVDFRQVRTSLGYGLDEKAIEAVKQWRFDPGRKEGKPVPVYVTVLMRFSLQ